MVVVADGADGEAARAVAERADDAQEPLPEAENVAALDRFRLLVVRLLNEGVEEFGDLHVAEFLRLDRTAALVDAEVEHGIRGAGIKAARAGFADADLLGDHLVGLELGFRQYTGQIDAGPIFRGQDVDL